MLFLCPCGARSLRNYDSSPDAVISSSAGVPRPSLLVVRNKRLVIEDGQIVVPVYFYRRSKNPFTQPLTLQVDNHLHISPVFAVGVEVTLELPRNREQSFEGGVPRNRILGVVIGVSSASRHQVVFTMVGYFRGDFFIFHLLSLTGRVDPALLSSLTVNHGDRIRFAYLSMAEIEGVIRCLAIRRLRPVSWVSRVLNLWGPLLAQEIDHVVTEEDCRKIHSSVELNVSLLPFLACIVF